MVTPEERAERCLSRVLKYDIETVGFEPAPELEDLVAAEIRAAVEARDFEWWSALAGVDSVGPNPTDVKKWVLSVQELVEDAARQEIIEEVCIILYERLGETLDHAWKAYCGVDAPDIEAEVRALKGVKA